MPKFIKVERSDMGGGYIEEPSQIGSAIESEYDFGGIDNMEPGETITLTVVQMSQEEFDKLPEFEGW